MSRSARRRSSVKASSSACSYDGLHTTPNKMLRHRRCRWQDSVAAPGTKLWYRVSTISLPSTQWQFTRPRSGRGRYYLPMTISNGRLRLSHVLCISNAFRSSCRYSVKSVYIDTVVLESSDCISNELPLDKGFIRYTQ